MRILGLSGGFRAVADESGPASGAWSHDGAAVLLDDGVIRAACEQERLDRIKHSDKAPSLAIDRVLAIAGASRASIDRVAYYASEAGLDRALAMAAVRQGRPRGESARRRVAALVSSSFDPANVVFVKHHLAHAASAYFCSGWDEALVVTLDGIGEDESGIVATGRGGALEVISRVPPEASLGQFYCDVIAFLGYGLFDEYKVMGLAPYGDPARFRALFREFFELSADGAFAIHGARIGALGELGPVRRRGEPFTQVHRDVAAALQEALAACIFHHVSHAVRVTGLRRLALAGGVAHNCTVNGQLLRSGRVDAIFVQPAAHDAGCALGAAQLAWAEHAPRPFVAPPRIRHVAWGTDATADEDAVLERLRAWERFVTIHRPADRFGFAAERLATGAVIGWVTGRAEFGPRALGQRSILADPRPAENKTIINAMVKKREGYRPFAPSVLLEQASAWFDVPEGLELPFMNFVADVKPEHRATLGAVTHVDGSARVQTVARDVSPDYHALIDAFARITGVPVLLNTSFNNHAEPIVDSVDDAVVTFLTTGLHALAVGPFWAEKRDDLGPERFGALVPRLPEHVRVERTQVRTARGEVELRRMFRNDDPEPGPTLSVAATDVLFRADGSLSLDALLPSDARAACLEEILELWSRRLVILAP